MTKRKIITIDEKKCNGCGVCIPNCPEGAIQLIDGKARLIGDIYCDGLGACLGHCPQEAIKIEEREAETYDEKKVMENVVKHGENTIIAHLTHLKDHGENLYLNQALEYLKENKISVNFNKSGEPVHNHECPGAKAIDFTKEKNVTKSRETHESQLRQWPLQMHLISPTASYFQGSDLLLVADCVGYALGDFHHRILAGNSITIACPKLDSDTDIYVQKLIALIDQAKINTLTVVTIQVPCCHGLLVLAKKAVDQASRSIPIKHIIVSIKGEILKEEWI